MKHAVSTGLKRRLALSVVSARRSTLRSLLAVFPLAARGDPIWAACRSSALPAAPEDRHERRPPCPLLGGFAGSSPTARRATSGTAQYLAPKATPGRPKQPPVEGVLCERDENRPSDRRLPDGLCCKLEACRILPRVHSGIDPACR